MLEIENPPAEARQVARTERRFSAESDRWDGIYTDHAPWPARVWDRFTRQNVRQRFERTFEVFGPLEGASVLDLGCGSGRYLIEAASRNAGKVVGVDVSGPMIATAGRLATSFGYESRIELRVDDLYNYAPAEPFDFVVANGVFDYLPEPPRALARMGGMMRRMLVASFPDRAAFRAMPRRLYWRARGLTISQFHEGDIAALAQSAGFARFTVERIGPIFLLIVDRRGR